VVFDHEVEQMRGLAFDGEVGRFTENRLFQIAQNGRQAITPRPGEQLGCLTPGHQFLFECVQIGHGFFG